MVNIILTEEEVVNIVGWKFKPPNPKPCWSDMKRY